MASSTLVSHRRHLPLCGASTWDKRGCYHSWDTDSLLCWLFLRSSSGPDGIPNTFLRRYLEVLAYFLVSIFRLPLCNGFLAENWLVASGILENDGPISVMCGSFQMMGHTAANYILRFLNDSGVLADHQHSFQKGLSTVTRLTLMVHNFVSMLKKSDQTCSVFRIEQSASRSKIWA